MDHQNRSTGIFGILFVVFIVLKLTGVIEWSWLWVLSPLWIPFALFAAIFILIVIFNILKKIF